MMASLILLLKMSNRKNKNKKNVFEFEYSFGDILSNLSLSLFGTSRDEKNIKTLIGLIPTQGE